MSVPVPINPDQVGMDKVYHFLRHSTIPGLLRRRARETPDEVAFRHKFLGIYKEVTWKELWQRSARIAAGLASLGIGRGDRVAIVGDPFPEWFFLEMAALGVGAITYGIYPTSSPGEIRYLLRHGGAKVVIAENQEYVDKVLALLPEVPEVRAVVAVDTRALFLYRHPLLRSLQSVEQEAPGDVEPWFSDQVDGVHPGDPACIVYTSGTTAHPKGAVLTHGRHLAACFTLAAHYPRLYRKSHRTVAYLPLCHVLGRDVALTLPLMTQVVPHFGESIDDLAETIYEVGPTVLFTVPRYLQKFASQALVGIEQSSRFKRFAYRQAMKVGRRYAERRWEGCVPVGLRLLHWAADRLVFHPLRDRLGLSYVELVVCAGAPLPYETAVLWQIWGINLCDLYGQTEAGGALITAQKEPFPKPGDVGVPAEGWEVRLGPDGEVQVRSPDLFGGYWRDEEATKTALVGDWLLTGDVGEWTTGGRLRLVDRKKDILVTEGGKTLSPSAIENALKSSPYIKEAVVFGHGRKYITALVEVDYEAVAEWARANGIVHTGYATLVEHPKVVEFVGREVAKANQLLSRVEQVKKFRILPKELDPEFEGDPVTPTRKVKRQQMYERFRDLVESMYDTSERLRIARQIENQESEMVGSLQISGRP